MRNCAYCNQEFEAKRERLCCSRSCSAKLTLATRGIAVWTSEENQFLEDNLGSIPYPMLIQAFKKWAKKQGLPDRTDKAIESGIQRIVCTTSLRRKCTEDNFTVSELARGLGFPKHRLRVFLYNGKLKPRKISTNQNAVTRKQAIALILENPSYFTDCDRDNLFWLFEDNDLVQQVKSAKPSTRGFRRAVRCYAPNGVRVYSGANEAAKANSIACSSICRAIKKNCKYAGMKWEWV